LEWLAQVQRELVAKEIEVHPSGRTATFGAAQHACVKLARGVQVGDMKGKVKEAAHGREDSSLVDNAAMFALQVFRSNRHIARWVLAWFASACMVAVAAPIVAPQSSILVCSAAGEVKWVPVGAAESAPQSHSGFDAGADLGMLPGQHTLDCVLCLPWLAPPPAPLAQAASLHAGAQLPVLQLFAFVSSPGYASPPARGPPQVS
jgi:hypothetical protein